jgi:hypothetical protein
MGVTTRPLHVVRDPGPGPEWLAVLEDVQEAMHQPPSYSAHVLLGFLIVGLVGALVGAVWTVVALWAVGVL